MVTGENVGGNPAMGLVFHPGGSRNTPSRFMLRKTGDKRLVGLPKLVTETLL